MLEPVEGVPDIRTPAVEAWQRHHLSEGVIPPTRWGAYNDLINQSILNYYDKEVIVLRTCLAGSHCCLLACNRASNEV